MSGSFKTCSSFISLLRKMKLSLQQLMKRRRRRRRRRKHKIFSSSFDFLTSSFATMEVSTQFKQIFKAMDSDGDGKVSSVELSELLACLLGCDESSAAKEAEGIVRQMDKNGDGLIDMDEFMVAVVHDEANEEDSLMDAFLMFDSDENGLISAMELRRVLINLGCHQCSLEDCRRMIDSVDKNGDGFVDFHEFRSMLAA